MKGLLQYWKSISARERLVVTLGLIGVGGILLYTYVWVPWHQKLGSLRQQVPAQRKTLAWMERTAREIKPLLLREQEQDKVVGTPILTLIDNSANSAGLREAIRQIQPGNDSDVKVWLQDVAFDGWLAWIEQLRTKGVFVTAVSVTRSQTPNTVNIRVTLKK